MFGVILQLEITIPVMLKKLMIENHDAVVYEHRLVPLPRRPTVTELLKKFVGSVNTENGARVSHVVIQIV